MNTSNLTGRKGITLWATVLLLGMMLGSSQPVFAAAVVGNGTPSSCNQAALASALLKGGTITFNCGADPVTINLTKELEVAKMTSIDGGNKVTLSGQNNVRVFYVNKYEDNNGMTFYVKNITLKNGKATGKDPDLGGCIFTRFATLSIKNSTLSGCQAAKNGGAIRNLKGSVIIDRSTFTGNKAYQGGSIFSDAESVATVVKYSTFTNNVADNNGGAIFVHAGPLTIEYSDFDSNKVTGQASGDTPGLGGAVYTQKAKPVSIYFSTFTNNFAFEGGGVFIDRESTAVVEKSTFIGNKSTKRGGGLDTWMSVVSVLACVFENNSSNDGGGVHNGTQTKMNLEDSFFRSNTAVRFGGGMSSNDAPLTVLNVRFYRNLAGTDMSGSPQGGGLANFGGSVKLTNVSFYKNIVQGSNSYGGGFATNAPSEVINTSLGLNQAAYGGGIFGTGSTINVRNSTLSNNYGTNGSNLRQGSDGTIVLKNSIIYKGKNDDNCSASSGRKLTDNGNNLQYGDTSCMTNKSQVDPMLGTMRNNGGNTLTMAINGSSPARNAGSETVCPDPDQRQFIRADDKCDIGAYEYGAVVPSGRERVSMRRSLPAPEIVADEFDPNEAQIKATMRQVAEAAFMARWVEPENEESEMSQVVGRGTRASCTEAALDAALAAGGTITFDCGPTPTTINITTEKQVTKNTTLNGGGFITLDGKSSVRIFYVNKDETNNGLTFTLSNITLKNGKASGSKDPTDGGCMFIRNAKVVLDKVTMSACRASERGGGIRNLRGDLTVTNSTFSDNQSTEGASIFADGDTTNSVTGSTFTNNASDNNGAGIFVFEAPLTVANSTFTGNKAKGTAGGSTPGLGGAIYTHSTNSTTISGCTFSNNSALEGGAVFADRDSIITVTDSTFTSNTSTKRGGGLDTFEGRATVSRTSFTSNSSNVGGALHNGTNNKLTLDRITFTGNTAKEDGGAFRNDNGDWTITNSSFSGNIAGTASNQSRGGAIANFGGSARVESSTFVSNEVKGTGTFGGGVSSTSNITIINSTFSGNKAVSGGAAYANDNNMTLRNSTLMGNIATDKGGAIRESSGASATLQNSIVANNSPENCSAASGNISNGGNNIQFGDTSCFGSQPQDDPKLGALGNNGGPTLTMALGAGSPAIDKANTANCPATDQRGAARVGTCDIGAFEFGGTPSNEPTPTPTATTPAQTPTATTPAQTPTPTATTPAQTPTPTATTPAQTPTATVVPTTKRVHLPLIVKSAGSFEVPK